MANRLLNLMFALVIFFTLGCRNNQNENTDDLEPTDNFEQETRIDAPAPEAKKPATIYRNQPISYGKLEPNQYAILAGKYRDSAKAIERSRELRQLRVNNYIFEDGKGNYLVLIGHFVTMTQAERKLAYLEKRNLDNLRIYSLDNG